MQIGWILDSNVATLVLDAKASEIEHGFVIYAEVLFELYQRLLLYLFIEELFLFRSTESVPKDSDYLMSPQLVVIGQVIVIGIRCFADIR